MTIDTHDRSQPPSAASTAARMLCKVPEVTLFFWVIKVLATTVGETAADFLNENLGLGLTTTTWLMSIALVAALVAQFRTRRYVPGVYWLSVVLISIVGTLITDNLTDNLGVSLKLTTAVFAVALTVDVLGVVRQREDAVDPLDRHDQARGVLLAGDPVTFALGTAAGDLIAEQFGIGYWKSALIFGGAIGGHRPRLPVRRAQRDLRVLGGVHPHPSARRIVGRLLLPAPGRRRPRSRHRRDDVPVPRHHLAVVIYLSRSRVDQPALAPADA